MKGKVFADSAGIINWIPEDPTGDVEGTKLAVNVIEGLLDEQGPSTILVDLSKAPRPNALQRQIVINGLQSNFHNITKIAFFGHNALMKAVAYFVINNAGFQNIRFFANRNQATQWLLEKE